MAPVVRTIAAHCRSDAGEHNVLPGKTPEGYRKPGVGQNRASALDKMADLALGGGVRLWSSGLARPRGTESRSTAFFGLR